MKEKSFYDAEVDKKIEDYLGYNFSGTGKITPSDTINILQDFMRASEDIGDMLGYSESILRKIYSSSSNVCLFRDGEQKDIVINNNIGSKECTLDKVINETILQEKYFFDAKEPSQIYVPLKGKSTITKEIKYPSNERDIIGSIHATKDKPLTEDDITFITRYGRRLGPAIHEHMLEDHYRNLNEHYLELIGDVAHHFRGLTQNIIAGLKLLSKGVFGKIENESVLKRISYLRSAAERLGKKAEDYLGKSFFLRGHLSFEKNEVDMRDDIIEKSINSFMYRIAEFDINCSLDDTLGNIPEGIKVKVDEKTISSVVDNLLENAIKYGGPHCTIAIGYRSPNKEHVITVWDSGNIIPEDKREKLFKEFERLDAHGIKGTGLGLAWCKEVVEKHGGRIGYVPEGNGNLFWFSLPK